MRRRLFFTKEADRYEAGRWYDNVPEKDFAKHTKSGAAESVYAEECRCLVTYEGLVVRDGGTEDRPCAIHKSRKRVEVRADDEPVKASRRTAK
jgi:hypothetical protein